MSKDPIISRELLEGSECLQGLTDEQLAAINTIAGNVFGDKFSKMYNELDQSTMSITGEGKKTQEKTTEYIGRMLTSQKARIAELNEANAALETKVKEGSADKDLIAQKDATILDIQARYAKLQEKSKADKEEFESKLSDIRISSAIESEMSGISFAEGVNKQMLEVVKQTALNNVKAKKPSFVSINGTEVLVFHNEDGSEMRNDKNQMNLYTAGELLKEQLAGFGVVADAKPTGNGGRPAVPHGSPFGGARTKAEAMENIGKELAGRGLVRTDPAFQAEMDKAIKDNISDWNALK